MTLFGKPSDKLAKYLDKVRDETGREILMKACSSVGLGGMLAAFRPHPTAIFIEILSDADSADPVTEHSIAHEITHGLLLYARGYSEIIPTCTLDEHQRRCVSLTSTMIDDIVVNKILQDEGFPPLPPSYFPTVAQETKAARKGKDYYHQFSNDPVFRSRFIVFRYVAAWAALEYFRLAFFARRTLVKFLKVVPAAYPEEHQIACKVQDLFSQHDVFSVKGHLSILEGVLALWELDGLVKLSDQLATAEAAERG